MRILGVIPSRYASTRFPGKPLADIAGKTMIQRVVEQVQQSDAITDVIVATDDQRILDHVESFGGNVCMTSQDHQSGTDRCQEALQSHSETYDYVVNIQGDEPFIQPSQINQLAQLLDGQTQLATLIKPISDNQQIANPNIVKVVKSLNEEAIYFSRSPIPYLRNHHQDQWTQQHQYYKHIGIYAYRSDVLDRITSLPISSLESAESLEQLRWLENGYHIKTAVTTFESIGIDTPEDLARAIINIQG